MKDSTVSCPDIFELVREFEQARDTISLCYDVDPSLLRLPPEIEACYAVLLETSLGQFFHQENENCLRGLNALRYWFEKLEGRKPSREDIYAYMAARHGLSPNQVGEMTSVAIAELLQQDWDRQESCATEPHPTVAVPLTTLPLLPTCYLLNWREILDALNQPNNDECQRRVRELNKKFTGPIILPSKGGQPRVTKSKLLAWWNDLEEQFRESDQKQADTDASLQAQYTYGRNTTILPDISGHIQKRRGKKRDCER